MAFTSEILPPHYIDSLAPRALMSQDPTIPGINWRANDTSTPTRPFRPPAHLTQRPTVLASPGNPLAPVKHRKQHRNGYHKPPRLRPFNLSHSIIPVHQTSVHLSAPHPLAWQQYRRSIQPSGISLLTIAVQFPRARAAKLPNLNHQPCSHAPRRCYCNLSHGLWQVSQLDFTSPSPSGGNILGHHCDALVVGHKIQVELSSINKLKQHCKSDSNMQLIQETLGFTSNAVNWRYCNKGAWNSVKEINVSKSQTKIKCDQESQLDSFDDLADEGE
ncbi:hypothetical protein C8F01DRAFT_1232153 [Mycena amicta]|nr:hypothetical protein C8F01DRAFT_1232153 [Mycena amicta]